MIPYSPRFPEQAMARELIYTAIADFLRQNSEYDQARDFFYRGGDYLSNRQFWCDMAGFDADWVVRRINAAKKKKKNWRYTSGIGQKVLGISNLRDLIKKTEEQCKPST